MFIVPATILLTVSYFVLFANQKAESGKLKTFGWVLAVLLWVAAFVVLSSGIYISANGHNKMMGFRQKMCPMMQGQGMNGMRMPMGMRNMMQSHNSKMKPMFGKATVLPK
jgi:hypothetical protein